MVVRLKPEHEAMIEQDVAEGRYASVEEYVAEAVELLHERRQWGGETLDEFNASLEGSIAQAERGELMSEDEVRREMRAMKAEWRARQAV
jgi:Arc/MetJ-type ribon-helix-helix transcriptional regulator